MSASDPRQVRQALRVMETQLQGLVGPTEQRLHEAERTISQAEDAYQSAMAVLSQALARAEADLDYCLSWEDEDGRRANCSAYYRRCDEIRRALSRLAAQGQRLEQAVRQYQLAATGAREAIGHDIPKATHWLREREQWLAKFENDSVSISSSTPAKSGGGGGGRSHSGPSIDAINALGAAALATGSAALLSAVNSFFDGMGIHGNKYQKARQEYLRSVLHDLNQPRHVRGWVKQELNRLEATRRAVAAGLQPPGGSPRNLRGIPGLDVGHRFPGLDVAANFRLEDASINRARYHIAKRLGLSDLFR